MRTDVHAIQLTRVQWKTRITCACGANLGLFPPQEGAYQLAVYKAHVQEATGAGEDPLPG